MTGSTTTCCLLLLAGFLCFSVEAQQQQATINVLQILNNPQKYNKALRPAMNNGSTVVQLQTYFRDMEIDDGKMEANFDITFRMLWHDPRLAYGLSDVQHVTLVEAHKAWLPDAFFKNADVTQHSTIYPENYLRVFPNGHLIYSTRITVRQSCPMDLQRFPHDTQKCYVRVASYGYTTQDIVFEAGEDAVSLGSEIHAARFSLEEFNTGSCNSKTSTGEYSCLEVSIKIRRAFGAYMLEWYVPTMFLVVVAWFTFMVPKDQFLPRLLLVLVPLVALASFANVYTQTHTSVAYIRAIDIFTGVSLLTIFCTFINVIATFVRHHKAAQGEPASSSSGAEDVEGKGGSQSAWRRLAGKMMQRADHLSKMVLICGYIFFLFVYFVAYCGTG